MSSRKLYCVLEQGKYVNEENTLHHKKIFSTDFCDWYRLNWFTDKDTNAFLHKPNITWSEGRNLLYHSVPKKYEYYIFIDDDIKFIGKNIAGDIQNCLLKYNPISGTFFRNKKDVWTFSKEVFNKQKKLHKECWPVCGFDLDCQIFHKSLAELSFPVIFHGSGGSLRYPQFICHTLFPSKQLVFSNVLIENTRTETHSDTSLTQFNDYKKIFSLFSGLVKPKHRANLKKLTDVKEIVRINSSLYDSKPDLRKVNITLNDLSKVINADSPLYRNRKISI